MRPRGRAEAQGMGSQLSASKGEGSARHTLPTPMEKETAEQAVRRVREGREVSED